MTDEPKEIADLEQAPKQDEVGTEAEQYGAPAKELGDEGAGPDTGEGEAGSSSSEGEGDAG